jgi:hypothetical protein|tara:strand:+ start:152 stop:400 length:249 start_codon:yes stop_codon:yes gene_type:complete
MSEIHSYTYFHPDRVLGSPSEGFITPRMKNTAFCPSSAIEKLGQNKNNFQYQQKYDLAIMDESGLFMDIFVYLFKWNDSNPG